MLLGCFGSDVYIVLGLFDDMGLNNQHILHLGGEEHKVSKCLELTASLSCESLGTFGSKEVALPFDFSGELIITADKHLTEFCSKGVPAEVRTVDQIPSLASLSITADSYDERCDALSSSTAGSCGGRRRAAIQSDGTLY